MNPFEIRGYLFLIIANINIYGTEMKWVGWLWLGLAVSQFIVFWIETYQEYKRDSARYEELRNNIKNNENGK